MTTKETESELNDFLKRKCALTENIDYNTDLVERMITAVDLEPRPLAKAVLHKRIKTGQAIVSAQVTERMQLSAPKIAKMVGVPLHIVRYQEKIMLGVKL